MEKRRFYYGWVIVGLSMVSMAFWFGIRATFSVFFVALIDHFHWGRAEAAGAQSIAMLVYMIMAPITGTLVDRIDHNEVCSFGYPFSKTCFLLLGRVVDQNDIGKVLGAHDPLILDDQDHLQCERYFYAEPLL